jgi:RimJ/RimL family protein N-acetyltransferase
MRVVTETRQEFIEWFKSRSPEFYTGPNSRTISITEDDGTPVAVAVFDGWDEHAVELSITSDGTRRWAKRDFIEAVYSYAFDYAGKVRITMITAVSNQPAINMHDALGHTCEGRLRNWFGRGADAYIYSLTIEDWQVSKWNRRKGHQHG